MDEELTDNPLTEDVLDTIPSIEPSGSDLIDSTQNVIMDAAENVSQVLDAAGKAAQTNISAEPFYTEVEFWIGMAFILSVIVIAKPCIKFIKSALKRRINKVVTDIDEAVKLRDDAQELLARYERKTANVAQETAEILEQGKKNLQNLEKDETKKLQEALKNKEKETQRRILTSTEKAKNEINQSASKLSVGLALKALNRYIDHTHKSVLIDEAIAELDKFVK